MNKVKIIADSKIPFLKGALEGVAEIVYKNGNEISKTDISQADALIIRTRTQCSADLLKDSKLKFIASATIGFDHIDTDYCRENGIAWTNAPGCNSSSVEQYVVAALLELAQQFNFQLKDKTIGIIGVGSVGAKVANVASALGMRVLLNDPPRSRNENKANFIDLEKLKKEADIISFHVPLIREGKDKTMNLADEHFFKSLKKGTIIINTSRGEIMDENALEKAIDEKILSATVIDVWRNEPSINLSLLEKASIATPHIAGYSADGKAKGTEMSVQALSKYFNLGLSAWEPENIPLPDKPIIRIDCLKKSIQEILFEAYKHIYDINVDNLKLKNNPNFFENLRGDYPVRREAKAYTISLGGDYPQSVLSILEQLGFQIQK